jgi:hypothetical protein
MMRFGGTIVAVVSIRTRVLHSGNIRGQLLLSGHARPGRFERQVNGTAAAVKVANHLAAGPKMEV